jgi:hypothetical protein
MTEAASTLAPGDESKSHSLSLAGRAFLERRDASALIERSSSDGNKCSVDRAHR